MLKLTIVQRDGTVNDIDGESGASVMEVIRDSGFDEMQAICGGTRSCATCHVYVSAEFLPLLTPMSDDEDYLLDGSDHRTEASRLSCQIVMTESIEGIRVTIAPQD